MGHFFTEEIHRKFLFTLSASPCNIVGMGFAASTLVWEEEEEA